MKKTLLFLFAAFFAMAMNAQTLFEENFDNGIPNTWQTIDDDGDGFNWLSVTDLLESWGASDYLEYYVYDGTGNAAAAISYDYSDYSSLDADDWLISPAITIPSSGAYCLKWYAMSDDASYPEHYAVYVATGNTIEALSATSPLFNSNATEAEYELQSVPLVAYAGQTIYIAFRHQCSDKSALYLDQITVEELPATPEIKLAKLNIPSVVDINVDYDVRGTVINQSGSALNSFDITYSIDGGANVTTRHISGLNIGPVESYTFVHDIQFSFNTAGPHTITVTVSNPNDVADDESDNATTITVNACDHITQLPMTETFDDDYDCWQLIDYDGDGINIMRASDLLDDLDEYVYGGTGDAIGSLNIDPSTYPDYQTLESDHFVVSPVIEIPANGALATWYHRGFASDEDYDLYITTSNDIDAIALESPIETITAPGDALDSYSYALTDYAGQSIRVIFRHNSGFAIIWDQFTVTPLSSTPEIQLQSLNVPTQVSENESFNISGTVLNNSSAELNSFKVQYTLNGTTSSVYTVSGIAVASGETYEFTHNAPASLAETGNYALTVTVSEPNGEADETSDNMLTAYVAVCGVISDLPYTEGFENGSLGCWQAVASDDNSNVFGYTDLADYLHSGTGAVRFNSYDEVESGDYAQYLISPELNLSGDATFSFYYSAGATRYSAETAIVMVSSTTNDTSAFSVLGEQFSTSSATWELNSVTIPANTKYVAIKYTSNYKYYMGIDDITIDYAPVTYNITVVTSDPSMGTVSGGGEVAEHGSTTITATALPGYHFVRWNEDITTNPYTITDVTANATYTAYFEQNSIEDVYYTITVVSENTNMGTVSGGGQVLEHGSTTITATALPGYHFVRWNENITTNPYTITDVTANATYTAFFEADAPQQGIDDVTTANVKLYPNPTTGNLYVEVEGLQKVEVIDAVGRIVLSQNNGTVNMGKLANGVYSVRVTANGNTAVKKVVKR